MLTLCTSFPQASCRSETSAIWQWKTLNSSKPNKDINLFHSLQNLLLNVEVILYAIIFGILSLQRQVCNSFTNNSLVYKMQFVQFYFMFVFCCLVGTFPFNAFLSGFISCIGLFILGVCLRLQVASFNQTFCLQCEVEFFCTASHLYNFDSILTTQYDTYGYPLSTLQGLIPIKKLISVITA